MKQSNLNIKITEATTLKFQFRIEIDQQVEVKNNKTQSYVL